MKLSKKGFDLINHFETSGNPSKYLKAYWDAHGERWTIGIGTTYYGEAGKDPVQKDDVITLDRAYELFHKRIVWYEKKVEKNVPIPLSQRQFDALVSLGYNIGPDGYPTLARMIIEGRKLEDIVRQWHTYNKAGGKVLDGLKWRRAAEFHYYCTGELVTNIPMLKKMYESHAVPAGANPRGGPGGFRPNVFIIILSLLSICYFFFTR